MKLRNRVAANIRDIRSTKALNQEAAARIAHVDRAHVGKIENARHAASLATLEGIANALDVDPTKLFGPRECEKVLAKRDDPNFRPSQSGQATTTTAKQREETCGNGRFHLSGCGGARTHPR
ncbi:helix-turn-helix transcriptional regulator [Leisingera sp. JC11]|uniref:helix-turn-helix domain-containing protein n=1 Tax=Leisingera sp. JC11 TaxID=3042469 RepID=UPI0034542FC8